MPIQIQLFAINSIIVLFYSCIRTESLGYRSDIHWFGVVWGGDTISDLATKNARRSKRKTAKIDAWLAFCFCLRLNGHHECLLVTVSCHIDIFRSTHWGQRIDRKHFRHIWTSNKVCNNPETPSFRTRTSKLPKRFLAFWGIIETLSH